MSKDLDYQNCYCYICNKAIPTPSEHLIEDEKNYLSKGEVDPNVPDLQPLLCGDEKCETRYSQLPEVDYSLGSAPYHEEGAAIGYAGNFAKFADTRNEVVQTDHPVLFLQISEQSYMNGLELLEPLFQEWLFFGLIQEFLGEDYHREDYIDGKFLTISGLESRIAKWIRSIQREANAADGQFTRYDKCFGMVFSLLMNTLPYGDAFNADLRSMIAMVAELFNSAIAFLFTRRSNGFFKLFGKQSLIDVMMSHGWCERDAADLVREGFYLCGTLFHSHFQRPHFRRQDHSECTKSICNFSRNDENRQMHIKHDNDCSTVNTCAEISLDGKQTEILCNLLDMKTIPLIKIKGTVDGQTLDVAIVPESVDTPYVAISHVCAQGLGNSYANSLYRCQLSRLFNYIVMLNNSRGMNNHKIDGVHEVFIWLDTFCCPVVPDGSIDEVNRDREDELYKSARKRSRKEAINMMRDIYMKADRILVIEAELEKHAVTNMPVLECAMRFLESSWMRRLWTLQEGALCKELWIQFQDRAVNANSMFLALRNKQKSTNLKIRTPAIDMIIRIRQIHRWPKGDDQALSKDTFERLNRALRLRATTKLSDEPICVATLLRLDVTLLSGIDGKVERMKMLWNMISDHGALRRGILFSSAPKLCDIGYRWAPESLLASTGLSQGKSFEGDAVSCDAQGLTFESAGHLILMSDLAPYNMRNPPRISGKGPERITLRHIDGTWMQLASLPKENPFIALAKEPLSDYTQELEGNFALIHESETGKSEANRCLLVEVCQDGVPLVCTPNRVVVMSKLEPRDNVILEAVYREMEKVRHTDDYKDRIQAVTNSEIGKKEEAVHHLQILLFSRIAAIVRNSNEVKAATMERAVLNNPTKKVSFNEDDAATELLSMIYEHSRYAKVTESLPMTQKWLIT